jgi:DNA-binding PadR family transcriptional regulator
MHGYQLMQAMADRTNGAWRPSPGAIYPTIAQLEDEGLVTTVAEGGRKLVTLTDAGRTSLADNPPGDPFQAMANEPGQKYDLRSGFEEIAIATRLIGKSGSVSQLEAAQQVLADARRALYLILAEGDRPEQQA